MIAHDMRTPLSALMFSLRNAKAATGNPDALHRALDVAERNTVALASIVEALLDTSPDGHGRVSHAECLPADLIASAIDQIAPQSEHKRQTITIGETFPQPVLADPTRIIRVLVNLLSNAIRFSAEGGEIRVDARLRLNDGHPCVVFSVSDNGPGVPISDITKIFGEGVSIAKGGKYSSGLGLAVCKELVEAHGGRIWVETDRTDGATFSFSIPLDWENPEAHRA
ncbi:two-component system, OmpR family [Terrimicrobium sacchariphilum]|uniref:histidine kinase n=1 Tax=Terrimicrobium sacchariphilum TaxID=690879 RepID=A0A146G982_TERSA|nr:HAMP domain-containing sensor histidine kinase [Terrimicrobium sacchariphilum]GAT34050.1 two-component system, OmpR family [Terrimicrobium sacchariphilum]